jgi:hypothetical protein
LRIAVSVDQNNWNPSFKAVCRIIYSGGNPPVLLIQAQKRRYRCSLFKYCMQDESFLSKLDIEKVFSVLCVPGFEMTGIQVTGPNFFVFN